MVNNELQVTKCNSLTDDIFYIAWQFGNITNITCSWLRIFYLFFLAFSFLFTWKLTVSLNIDQRQAQIKQIHSISPVQDHHTINSTLSFTRNLVSQSSFRENTWGKVHGQRSSLTLRGRWDQSYKWVKIQISENQNNFLLLFSSHGYF